MFNLPPGLFNLRILVNKQPLLTRWETTWGWASTDNANSPGFSARKFIIFSDLAAPNSSAQKPEQSTRVLDPSPDPGGWGMHPQQVELATLLSLPPPLCSLLSHGVPTVRYKFYLFSVQESREEAASQLSACLSPRTPIKGTNWTAIHQSRSQEWVLRAPGIR